MQMGLPVISARPRYADAVVTREEESVFVLVFVMSDGVPRCNIATHQTVCLPTRLYRQEPNRSLPTLLAAVLIVKSKTLLLRSLQHLATSLDRLSGAPESYHTCSHYRPRQ